MTGPPPPPPASGEPPQPPGSLPPPSGGAPPPPPPPPAGFAPSPAAAPGHNGLAVASMVLGIISFPLCFVFVPSVLALVFGIIALSQINGNPGQTGRGQAITGIVLGGVSLALIVLLIVLAPALDLESAMPALA